MFKGFFKIEEKEEGESQAAASVPGMPSGGPGASGKHLKSSVPPGLAALKNQTDLAACVMPLLEALEWRGDPRHVAESVPHFIDGLDLTSFRNILAQLHYESRPLRINLKRLDPRNMPCLFLPENGYAMVLIGLEEGHDVRVFDGGQQQYMVVPRSLGRGTAYFFRRIEEDELIYSQAKVGWFKTVTDRFIPLVYQVFGLTFLLSLLALATPLFVMAVYDKVVATGSLSTLAYFSVGVAIAILCDAALRNLRNRVMAFVGARLDTLIGNLVFQKILFLMPAFTERAGLGAQIARVKDFENIREFFTGPMAMIPFELPFVTIFLTVIAVLGGPLAVVPVVMIVAYALLGWGMGPFMRRAVSKGARDGTRKQEFVVETLNNILEIKTCGAEKTWMARYRDLSAKAALTGYVTSKFSSIANALAHVLMVSSAVATVALGVFRVLDGEMTVGALVACMILVWRVVGPLQTAFLSLARLTQVRSSIRQINNLMNIKGERQPGQLVRPIRSFQGRVTFSRVSLRYSPETDPALVGVDFDVEPGQVVAVVGGNGSGKSTVLKLIIAMYQPQAGGVRVDGTDIRQIDPIELRHAVSYVPQIPQFYYGTVSQNLRLANPLATDEDLHWAVNQAGALDDVLALSQGTGTWERRGFDVRIGDQGQSKLTASLMQRLNLARGYIKRSRILLLDEPGNSLDFEGDKFLMQRIAEMKGEVSIFIVTHRPSHLQLADSIVWLDAGHLRAFGPAEQVRAQMPKDFV